MKTCSRLLRLTMIAPLIFLGIFLSSYASADICQPEPICEPVDEPCVCPPVCEPDYYWEKVYCRSSKLMIGANYSHLNLKAEDEPLFKGNLGGAHALYQYQPINGFYAGVEFDWRQGSTHGDGGSRHILDLKAAERFGYTWTDYDFIWCGDSLMKTVFAGFGFRFLGHHFHSSLPATTDFNSSFFPPFFTDETSIKFQYFEFYFPVGFLSEYTINSYFSLGLNATWMAQAFSTVQIRPLGGTYWSLKNTFGNLLIEAPFNFYFTENRDCTFVISPFYERWQDGQTTAKTSGGIPLGLGENTYNFWGVDVNFVYSF